MRRNVDSNVWLDQEKKNIFLPINLSRFRFSRRWCQNSYVKQTFIEWTGGAAHKAMGVLDEISNLPITLSSVDNFNYRVLSCKPISVN